MPRQSQYKHIIWDWNGTLMDDTWLCVEVINGILSRRGMLPIDEYAYRKHFDFPVSNYYQWLGFDLERDRFEDISLEFITEYEKRRVECALQPGVFDVLEMIRSIGIFQYILSAYSQKPLEEIVQFYGLSSFFKKLTGNTNIHAGSKVELGRNKAAGFNCDPKEILLIGDTRHDFEVADAIGADCVLVSHGHHLPERLKECGVPVLSSLDGIKELIQY
jgi:phosphoglycolate phosphatase